MTVATTFIGLVPILLATGAGAGVMKRIAAPMIGGILTSFILELLVYPVIYYIWRNRRLARLGADRAAWDRRERDQP
jgi:Cu(I)/Ag(I) efflux system membrane protein CusA/SilA